MSCLSMLRVGFALVRVPSSPRNHRIAFERTIRRETLSALHHADVVRLLASQRAKAERFASVSESTVKKQRQAH